MNNLNDFNSLISDNIENISTEINLLIPIYNKLFNIENIFTSENGGKTRLHRQVFNENHELISIHISKINFQMDEILLVVRQKLIEILSKIKDSESTQWVNLVFDDTNFLELFYLDLNSKGLSSEIKQKYTKDIKDIISIKNRVFNWGYFIDMFDTSILDKYLNRLGVEDLINSTIIFEIIDSYALQFEALKAFSNEIRNLNNSNEKITNLNSINFLMELHKRRIDNFTYANVRYKIFIDYSCDVFLPKPIYLNKAYLENILSCFIEQSCLDVVKKELKKGKIQKQVDVSISINKGILKIVVKNNGFEVRNTNNLFISDMENKYILEARNLANTINAKLDIVVPESNEGMQYTLTMKLKQN